MDQKYRLKKEVRKHFKLSDRQAIRTLDKWNERFIGEEVLDKVEKVYVEYTYQTSGQDSLLGLLLLLCV